MVSPPKPLIALTLGDPAGVGPEIIAGAWPHAELHAICRPFVVGRLETLHRAIDLLGLAVTPVAVASPEEAKPTAETMPVLECGSPDAEAAPTCAIDPRSGQAAYDAVVTATKLALEGRVDAITTAPLHKEALHAAGHHYPGHTELLAEMCGIRDFAMMLYLGPEEPIRSPAGLAVVHVTLHTSMRAALEELTTDAVLVKCRLADEFMIIMKGERPNVGVCALNPHGGEGGLFGDEEINIIRPAVERGLAEGMHLEGPMPSDTIMVHAKNGRFDAVVAMIHDQGHIALKLLGMHRAVNVTLGLPIIRTSVAHGTAFDIAWQGKAEVGSMLEAVRVAAKLAEKRGIRRKA